MTCFSPSAWAAWAQAVDANSVAVDERCVNEGGKRLDGSFCREKAEENGWCRACADELFPPGWDKRSD